MGFPTNNRSSSHRGIKKKNDSGRCSRLQEGKIDLWLAYNPTALSLAFPVDFTVKHLSSYSLKLKEKC